MRQEHSDDKKEGQHTEPQQVHTVTSSCTGAWVFPSPGLSTPKKPLKKMKKINWKTVINFIITVLTAIASSFFVSSCK